jgi:hypothetical protein
MFRRFRGMAPDRKRRFGLHQYLYILLILLPLEIWTGFARTPDYAKTSKQ